jgi:hypothetical protein
VAAVVLAGPQDAGRVTIVPEALFRFRENGIAVRTEVVSGFLVLRGCFVFVRSRL